MKEKSGIWNWVVLLMPLLLFVVLVIPYQYVNSEFLVDWLGCGCPQLDEFGNLVRAKFNANDFTACFWTVIALCATALSVMLSKILLPKSKWIRALYIVSIFAVSLMIAYGFTKSMMWK